VEKYKRCDEEVKQQVRQEQHDQCACCGEVSHLQVHHKVSHQYGEEHHVPEWLINSKFNLVGLCGEKRHDCHEVYDEGFQKDKMVWPGEPLNQALTGLFAIALWHMQVYYRYIYKKK
jgi:hypothetical protein